MLSLVFNLEKIYLLSKNSKNVDYDSCINICSNISYIFFNNYFENLKNDKTLSPAGRKIVEEKKNISFFVSISHLLIRDNICI